MNIKIEVQPAPLWDRSHKLLGYFPAIFGPTRSGNRTYILPALSGGATPRCYSAPAAAMAAWEKGTPTELSEEQIASFVVVEVVVEGTVKKINQLELYRRPKVTL